MFSQQHIKGSIRVNLLEKPYKWAPIQACNQSWELHTEHYESRQQVLNIKAPLLKYHRQRTTRVFRLCSVVEDSTSPGIPSVFSKSKPVTKAWFWFWNEKYPRTRPSIGRFKKSLLCSGYDMEQSSWEPCKGNSLLFQLSELPLQQAVAHSAHTAIHCWAWESLC